MSCNGCRVLRKGCSESCILRPCLQWIDTAEAQGHATVFVAKFFGRAGLMSFISAVPESQRPALFQSLLYEACGRTVNPVNGAVGLLWTGNWPLCQVAVATVLRGGALRPIPEPLTGSSSLPYSDEASEAEVTCSDMWKRIHQDPNYKTPKRSKISYKTSNPKPSPADLDLSLSAIFPANVSTGTLTPARRFPENCRLGSPSMNSEDSGTSTCLESGQGDYYNQTQGGGGGPKLLKLFN